MKLECSGSSSHAVVERSLGRVLPVNMSLAGHGLVISHRGSLRGFGADSSVVQKCCSDVARFSRPSRGSYDVRSLRTRLIATTGELYLLHSLVLRRRCHALQVIILQRLTWTTDIRGTLESWLLLPWIVVWS